MHFKILMNVVRALRQFRAPNVSILEANTCAVFLDGVITRVDLASKIRILKRFFGEHMERAAVFL